ncbi:MAG: DUF2784 domain-containing protein [Gammaproteobacteria bacterium]|nr:DUF2784 domain-containing protein [Gammaproteobacteria bacterium]
MSAQAYAWLADATVTLHASFVLFVMGGEIGILIGWLRNWRWARNPPFRISHLAAILFVILEAWLGVNCPLTVLENRLREMAGQAGYELSFIGYWLNRILFYSAPEWIFASIYSGFGLLVVVTFIAYPPRRT